MPTLFEVAIFCYLCDNSTVINTVKSRTTSQEVNLEMVIPVRFCG